MLLAASSFYMEWWFFTIMIILSFIIVLSMFDIRIVVRKRDVTPPLYSFLKKAFGRLVHLVLVRLQGEKYLTIKVDGKYVTLALEDILWIEAAHVYVLIVTDQKKYLVRSTMKVMHRRLHKVKDFVRVHRSYIINKNKIAELDTQSLYIEGTRIPVGETHRKELKELRKRAYAV